MKKLKLLMVAGAASMLSSCDFSQIPGLNGKLSMEDSKAVGAACRHSGRALEDCFALNRNTYQSGVFDGWRDMNDYMLTNEIEIVRPEIRNAASKSDQSLVEPSRPIISPVQPQVQTQSPDPSGVSGHLAPAPQQGRQRWVPKDLADAPVVGPVVRSGPSVSPPSELPFNTMNKAEPLPKEPPAADNNEPSKPWERKKERKKHT